VLVAGRARLQAIFFASAACSAMAPLALRRAQGRIARASAIALVAVVLAGAPLAAQGRGTGMPRYDKATEITVKGIVEAVRPHHGRGGGTGLHLSLKTDAGTLDVHVGPTVWLTKQQYAFAEDDVLEITGSSVRVNGKDAFLAREIRKGDATMTLRSTDGRPRWSRRGDDTD